MILNLDNNQLLCRHTIQANTFWKRLCGLLPYKSLPPGQGMLIAPCKSVHTFFMRFPIDVIYLDRELRVLALYENVPRGKTLPYHKKAYSVLELPAGTIKATGTQAGHRLQAGAG
ncbi:MAG: DUF192 domain-containing protein [Syntrophomonadaceae bacterium]|nr:DUF192 domain-containing protein [Syntrophomonadaceae bacterium]